MVTNSNVFNVGRLFSEISELSVVECVERAMKSIANQEIDFDQVRSHRCQKRFERFNVLVVSVTLAN